jgi:hypothetical protein
VLCWIHSSCRFLAPPLAQFSSASAGIHLAASWSHARFLAPPPGVVVLHTAGSIFLPLRQVSLAAVPLGDSSSLSSGGLPPPGSIGCRRWFFLLARSKIELIFVRLGSITDLFFYGSGDRLRLDLDQVIGLGSASFDSSTQLIFVGSTHSFTARLCVHWLVESAPSAQLGYVLDCDLI